MGLVTFYQKNQNTLLLSLTERFVIALLFINCKTKFVLDEQIFHIFLAYYPFLFITLPFSKLEFFIPEC